MADKNHIIATQSQFYRNNYRKLLNLAFILTGLIFALIAYIVYEDLNKPTRDYFATTSNGQVIKILPTAAPLR